MTDTTQAVGTSRETDLRAPTNGRGTRAPSVPLPSSWHAGVWLVWALSAASCVELAPNPLYIALIIGIAGLAVSIHARPGPYARAFRTLVAVGVFFAILRMLLTAATTHGTGEVLFTTPHFGLPRVLGGFTVGGAVQTPVLLRSLAEGFAIVGIMAVFGAFNSVVSHSELVQSIPRAFYEIGLVVMVALAFVPSTLAAIHDVREADRARTGGHIVRRGRLLRQIVPVLELGLERAVTLAESMDARGFARGGADSRDRFAGWAAVVSLLALTGAFVALVGEANTVAVALGVAGALGLAGAIVCASGGEQRTRYRPRRMTRTDWVVAGMSLLAATVLAACSVVGDSSLSWVVSPLRWPTLHVVPALALVPLLVPIAVRSGKVT